MGDACSSRKLRASLRKVASEGSPEDQPSRAGVLQLYLQSHFSIPAIATVNRYQEVHREVLEKPSGVMDEVFEDQSSRTGPGTSPQVAAAGSRLQSRLALE